MAKEISDKILAKIARAEQHIQDFQLGISAFREANPYTVSVKEDSNTGKRIYYLSKIDPVPDALTAIASDVIQNLRSSLDHIAVQLVTHSRGGTKPDWKVYYPISGSAPYYVSTRKGVIKGVPQPVIDAIDATEPYKGGKGHALWQLKELVNPDKHELLIGAGAFHRSFDASSVMRDLFKEAFGRDISIKPINLVPAQKLFPMKVGDQLYSEPIDLKVTEERAFTFDIAFHAPGVIEGEPAIVTLKNLSNLVSNIVRKLSTFLA